MISALLMLAAGVNIPDERFGDWSVTTLENGATIASVRNNADASFGTICTTSGCLSFFNPALSCVEGTKFPALVNAPDAAFHVTLECLKAGGFDLYTFPLDDRLTEAMSVAGVLGMAYPMKSGEFKVARFSMTGAARATARAMQITKYYSNPRNAKGSDASTL